MPSSLSCDLLYRVLIVLTPYGRVFQNHFSVGNVPRIHELKAGVASFKQDGLTVQDYFGQFKLMWDDLIEYEPLSECCCGKTDCRVMKFFENKCEEDWTHQFLMGLDGTRFGTTRSTILCMKPTLSLDYAFSMVFQEERHQNMTRVLTPRTDIVGFSANASPSSSNRVSNSVLGSVTGRGRHLTCTHCGKTCHDVQACYQIIGVPWHTDSTRGRGRGRGSSGRGRGFGGRVNAVHVSANNA